MTPNTETAGKLALTIDPNGAWNDQRFAFCNALEAALNEAVAPQIRAAAWDELERLGVRPNKAEPELFSEAAAQAYFEAHYADAYRKQEFYQIACLLSGQLRQMEKRAAAANRRADELSRPAIKAEQEDQT